jgi:ABC-type amino acid transport substrate-binding protein
MRSTLRRQLWFFRAYAIAASLLLVVLTAAAARQSPPQAFGEIAVERINVVDRDGTLRMVISNQDRMHPGVMDGVVIDRARPVAGMLFFNDEGDEVGGLTYTGTVRDGRRQANAGIMFDQLKQDQTIGFSYSESNGRRSAGLQVWDRSDQPLGGLIEKLNAANRIQDATERAKALAAIRAEAPPGPRRVFVGKNTDRTALVSLSDAEGRPRLTIAVDAAGNPRIEFLDEAGTVTARLPAGK